MKVVLLTDVKGVGKKDDIVTVSDGYGRNFILKKKLGVIAERKHIQHASQRQQEKEIHDNLQEKEAQRIVQRIQNTAVTLSQRTNVEGHLFGSVHEGAIIELLHDSFGIDLTREMVKIDTAIKSVGTYTIQVTPYKHISTNITLNVVSEKS